MIPDFSGDFLNLDSTQDADIIEILDEGKEEFNSVLKKDMFNIHVRKGDKVMTYSPNNTSGRLLQDAFGKDSKDWIGKKFQIIHADKKMLIRPIKEQKV
jgi:hypothetical protein